MSSDGDFSIRKESQFDDSTDSLSILSASPPRHQINPSSRRTTNTGPKGVRADARAYEASKREANALKSLKHANLLAAPVTSFGESGSEASEDEWMSRWREKRMKELSKTGVAGVNLFGQVDDVDACGYLNAVDFEEFDDDETSKRTHARWNVFTVVLIYDHVSSLFKTCVNECSRRIQRCCFRCFRNLLDDILRLIFYDYRHSMLRICQQLHFLLYWRIVEEG
jgi:hypothetical protein